MFSTICQTNFSENQIPRLERMNCGRKFGLWMVSFKCKGYEGVRNSYKIL